MQLVSTEIVGEQIELTYADNQNADDAAQLVVVRMPTDAAERASLAYVRVIALQKAYDFLQGEIARLHNVIG